MSHDTEFLELNVESNITGTKGRIDNTRTKPSLLNTESNCCLT